VVAGSKPTNPTKGTDMTDRLRNRLDAGRQDGFTLIELLIVIVILGILAAIVVFAVGGISNRGQDAACQADKKTLEVAEEANFAQKGAYGDQDTLVANGFLHDKSTLYDVVAATGKVKDVAGSKCAAPAPAP
jgi:prepilin-type N-terminal cleavage/methylation domain-containing protein